MAGEAAVDEDTLGEVVIPDKGVGAGLGLVDQQTNAFRSGLFEVDLQFNLHGPRVLNENLGGVGRDDEGTQVLGTDPQRLKFSDWLGVPGQVLIQ